MHSWERGYVIKNNITGLSRSVRKTVKYTVAWLEVCSPEKLGHRYYMTTIHFKPTVKSDGRMLTTVLYSVIRVELVND